MSPSVRYQLQRYAVDTLVAVDCLASCEVQAPRDRHVVLIPLVDVVVPGREMGGDEAERRSVVVEADRNGALYEPNKPRQSSQMRAKE